MSEKFGEVLHAAREEKNISIAQVSETLKLTIEKIEEIEQSDIDHLPPAAFTCGYLRLFARQVGVNEEHVIELYYQATGEEPDLVPGATSEIPTQASSQHVGMRLASLAIIILIVVLTLLWWQDNSVDDNNVSESLPALNQTENAEATLPSMSDDNADVSLSKSVDDNDESVNEAVPDSSKDEIVELQQNKSDQTQIESQVVNSEPAGNEDMAQNEEPADEPANQELQEQEDDSEDRRQEIIELARKATPVAEVGVDTIQLNALDDCWIEISDANDQLLYFSLLKEGEEMHLSGQEPFKVFLGKAQAVQIRINDLPYDVSAYVRSNQVARFTMSMENAKKMQASENE